MAELNNNHQEIGSGIKALLKTVLIKKQEDETFRRKVRRRRCTPPVYVGLLDPSYNSKTNMSMSEMESTEELSGKTDSAKPVNEDPDPYQDENEIEELFPWQAQFNKLCRTAVGSNSMKMLENLLTVYVQRISSSVNECYTRPNRAAKLKKCMSNAFVFFHLFYQDIKDSFENSTYLEKMTELMAMYLDIEINASKKRKEHVNKIVYRLTLALNIFLDHSEIHILDVIIRAKFIHKEHREICRPVLGKLLTSLRVYPMNDTLYVRYLLVFKLWKKMVQDSVEKGKINKIAIQNLPAPSNFVERYKRFTHILPRVPKSMNVTTFYMHTKFDVKIACQAFVKKSKDSQGPIISDNFRSRFAGSQSSYSGKIKSFEYGVSRNLMNDIWSIVEPASTQKKGDGKGDEASKKTSDKPKKTKDWYDKEKKKNKNKGVVFGNFKENNLPTAVVPQSESVCNFLPAKEHAAREPVAEIDTNIVTAEIKPNIVTSVVTAEIKPNVVTAEIKPNVVTAEIMPNLVTAEIMPHVVTAEIKPNVVTAEIMPNVVAAQSESVCNSLPAKEHAAREPVAEINTNIVTAKIKPNIVTAEIKPNIVTAVVTAEIKPNVVTAEIKPNVVTAKIKPNVVTAEIKSNVVTAEIMPNVVAAEIKSNIVTTEIMPNVVAAEIMPNVVAAEIKPNVVTAVVTAEVKSDIVSAEVKQTSAETTPMPVVCSSTLEEVVVDSYVSSFQELPFESQASPVETKLSVNLPTPQVKPEVAAVPLSPPEDIKPLALLAMDMDMPKLINSISLCVIESRLLEVELESSPSVIECLALEEYAQYSQMCLESNMHCPPMENMVPAQEFLSEEFPSFAAAPDECSYYNARDLYENYNPDSFLEEPVSQTPTGSLNQTPTSTSAVESDGAPFGTVDYSSSDLNSAHNSIVLICDKDNVTRHSIGIRVPNSSDNNYYWETDSHQTQDEQALRETEEPVVNSKSSTKESNSYTSPVVDDSHLLQKGVTSNPYRKIPHPVSVLQDNMKNAGSAPNSDGNSSYYSLEVPIPVTIHFPPHQKACSCDCFKRADNSPLTFAVGKSSAIVQDLHTSDLKKQADELKLQDDELLKTIEDSMKGLTFCEICSRVSHSTVPLKKRNKIGSDTCEISRRVSHSTLPLKKRHKIGNDTCEPASLEGFPNFDVRPMISILSLQPGVTSSTGSSPITHHTSSITTAPPKMELLPQSSSMCTIQPAHSKVTSTSKYISKSIIHTNQSGSETSDSPEPKRKRKDSTR